jgi:hypothetical protein
MPHLPPQAILLETGILKKLQPAAASVLNRLADTFQKRANEFTMQQCTNILSSMTLLGQYNVPLNDAIVRRCLPELATADPALIGSLCYSLGIAGYSNHAFLKEMENLLTRKHSKFDAKSLAKAVWMLGRVHYNNEAVADLVQVVVQRATADSASVTVRFICSLFPFFLSLSRYLA